MEMTFSTFYFSARSFWMCAVITFFLSSACDGQKKTNQTSMEPKKMTEEDWKKKLTPEEYYILREKGTERPFTGKFYLHFEKGIYVCKGCGEPLFDHTAKFESHCGWPSFDREIAEGKIIKQWDYSHGMKRIEILCANCGGHLGHVFDDGPTETGLRYCVNSLSLDFIPEKNTK